MWFMPETNGIPLPETIKEIEEKNEKEIDLSNKLIIFEKDSTQLDEINTAISNILNGQFDKPEHPNCSTCGHKYLCKDRRTL